MTLDLFAAPVARLMEAGASLAEVAAALGHPMAEVSSTGQILTLRAGDLRRVLVYRIGQPPSMWIVMVPEDEDGRLFEAYDSAQGNFDELARRLQEALK